LRKLLLIFPLFLFSACSQSVNEFGLVQLSKDSHPNIWNNYQSEDNYSYTNKKGQRVSEGKHGDDWATPETKKLFVEAVTAFLKKTKRHKTRFIINDVSAYNPKEDLGHKTHFSGKAIDLRFITADGVGSNDIKKLSAKDIELNGLFVKELIARGFTKNYSDKALIPGTTHAPGHDNHLHIAR
jgi:hypothetical protein